MARQKRTWRQLLVQEVLRLSELDLSDSSERKAKKVLERIEELADRGWLEALPLGRLTCDSGLSALEQSRELQAQAIYLARCLQSGESYDPSPITITLEQGLERGSKGWVVGRWLRVDGDALVAKVTVALMEACRQDPGMRFLRCPICGLLAVVVRRGQKYCSSRCSRVAVDRKRNEQEKRKLYLAKAAYARRRGVPIEQVRIRKIEGRRSFYVVPAKIA